MDLDDSPVLESFEGLQREDCVYSKKYGLGKVYSFYNDEIIIRFSNQRKRFSVDDKEIRKIPNKYFEKSKNKFEININGKSMSYYAYKKWYKSTKKQIKEDKQKYVLFSMAREILNLSKNEFCNAIQANHIERKKFGKSQMIHRDDLLKLSKTFLK